MKYYYNLRMIPEHSVMIMKFNFQVTVLSILQLQLQMMLILKKQIKDFMWLVQKGQKSILIMYDM